MKIALIKPPQITNEVQPPLGLGYLASAVKSLAEVHIIDSIKNNLSESDLIRIISRQKYDIIGFQCYTVDFNTVKSLISKTRKVSGDSIIIVGGPHPTLDPINSLNHLNADYVFLGDSEISLPKFVKFAKNKKLAPNLKNIPGIAYRKGNKVCINKMVYPEKLDDYNPSWELYNLKSYPIAPHGAFYKQSPIAPIIITRGCPFNCTYCGGSKISGLRIRSHSADFVINQIETLVKRYGIREIHIEDDNFTMNRNFVIDFCKKLIDKNFGISWTCPNGVRIDTLDEELLRLMKKSGLYSLSVGIESGSDKIRNLMRKRLSTETIENKMKLIKNAGIDTIGFFIIGYPGETVEDINKTIDFACRLGLKRATFSAFKPFPGTDIYSELVKRGEIKDMDYNDFSLDKIVWAPKGISLKKLKQIRRSAFLRFYFRPEIMIGMLKEIKSFQNLKFIILRAYRWLIK